MPTIVSNIFLKKYFYSILNTENKNKVNLNPQWVTGFSDGEGCFSVIISKRNGFLNSWKITTSFEINLHIKDLDILLKIKDFFDVGIVSTRPSKFACVYRVTKNKDIINNIIPHFEKYPLISQKYSDFFLWGKVVKLIETKEHLSYSGFEKILSYYFSINKGPSKLIFELFPNIFKAERVLSCLPLNLDPNWVSGFSAGESGFSIGGRSHKKNY